MDVPFVLDLTTESDCKGVGKQRQRPCTASRLLAAALTDLDDHEAGTRPARLVRARILDAVEDGFVPLTGRIA